MSIQPLDEYLDDFNLTNVHIRKARIDEYLTQQISKVRGSFDELVTLSKQPRKEPANVNNPNRRVQFNVGGKLYSTSFLNVTKEPSILQMVCVLNPDQPIFIDRDPEYFDLIMEYLRGNKLPNVFNSKVKRNVLLEEAEFYEIKGLIEQINSSREKQEQTPKKSQQIATSTTNCNTVSASEGSNLMREFEEEIEAKMAELSNYLQLGSSCSKEQTKKIRRYFGWTPVKLDVGGVLFEAGEDTLSNLQVQSKTFKDLFSHESDGTYFIDRDPSVFHLILRVLREQSISSFLLGKLRIQFQSDLEFYGLDTTLALVPKISFVETQNMQVDETNCQYKCVGGSTASWNKQAKSNPLPPGKHSLSVKIVQTTVKNIMFGCGTDKPLGEAMPYTTSGKYLYFHNCSVHGGSWPSGASPNWGSTLKVGDIITLELDTEKKSLTVYLNNNTSSGVMLCSAVPILPEYYFYVFGYDNDDIIEIV